MFKKLLILSALGGLLLGIITIIVSLPNYVFAQSVDTAWVRRYNGPADSTDLASAIAVDGSGNVYVTGSSYGSGTYYDYATIKYYPNGDTSWVRRYNGFGNGWDEACAIEVDNSGNVYVLGRSDQDSSDIINFARVTIKYLPNGDTSWVRYYGPENYCFCEDGLAVDNFGNVYTTGASGTLKYDSTGNQLWVGSWGGEVITLDASDNIYVTGGGLDYVTIKYYSNGDTAWVRKYNGLGNSLDYPTAIVVDNSSNVYVTGWSVGSGTDDDYATIKYYSNGDTAWVRRYNNAPVDSTDRAWALAVDNSGNVYVTGWSIGSGTLQDYATLKYSPNGDTAWVRRYNGSDDYYDWASDIRVDYSGNVYVTGYSIGYGYDYATIKYYPNGDTAWVIRYNGPVSANDIARALTVDDSGYVYVTGESVSGAIGARHYDFATIKYKQDITPSVKDETSSRVKPSKFALSQNYPNPFNQTTKIEFALAHSGFVSLTIYDLLGRKVRTLVSENLSSGCKSVLWDGKDDSGKEVASGIYFYRLKIGDFSEAKRLVLLK